MGTFYYIAPDLPYLQTIATWVLDHNQDSLHKLKIVLPDRSACLALQNIFSTLMQSTKASFLPKILTITEFLINEVGSDFRYISATSLEQELMLTDIVKSNPPGKISLSLLQAWNFARDLIAWSNKLTLKAVKLTNLHEFDVSNAPEYLEIINSYIARTLNSWHTRLEEIKLKENLSYIDELILLYQHNKTSSSQTIIAGFNTNHQNLINFLHLIATNGTVIIPPLSQAISPSTKSEFAVEYIKDNYILKALPIHSINSNLQLNSNSERKIPYVCTENEFEEAFVIANLCKKLIEEHSKSIKIGIIIHNNEFANLVEHNLQKLGINFNNLLGYQLYETTLSDFLISIIKFCAEDFTFFNLLQIINSKYLFSNNNYPFFLELLNNSKSKNCTNEEELIEHIATFDDGTVNSTISTVINTLINLKDLRNKYSKVSNFSEIIKNTINCAEEISSEEQLWVDAEPIINFLQELVSSSSIIKNLVEPKEVLDLLIKLLQNSKYYKQYDNTSYVTILSAKQAVLSDVEFLIITQCNEDFCPKIQKFEFIPPSLFSHLEEDHEQYEISTQAYYFDISNRKNSFITRSKEYKRQLLTPSRFLLQLIASNLAQETYSWPKLDQNIFNEQKEIVQSEKTVCATFFPLSISATNIELIVRNPYAFYAKKILRLKKLACFLSEPNVTDFGIIVHNIIAEYTKCYCLQASIQEKKNNFLAIAEQYLNLHNKEFYNLWKPKLELLTQHFIHFDENRRTNATDIFAETAGSLKINCYPEQLKELNKGMIKHLLVTAIADRIEISKEKVSILDYKTGIVPSKREVYSGIASQLVVESMILNSNGFHELLSSKNFRNLQNNYINSKNDRKLLHYIPVELAYVKISCRPPFIKMVSIDLSTEELENHYNGMVNLLSNFMCLEKSYPILSSSKKYQNNIYRHLLRE